MNVNDTIEDPEDFSFLEERTEVVTRDEFVPRASGQPYRLGRYKLDKLIGEGGMAEVYLAHTEGTSQQRAVVKRIRPTLLNNATSKKNVDMFLREAALLASLDHPNIVRIFELGIEPPRNGKTVGEHFIAMEFLDGLTLRELALRQWQAQKPLCIEFIVRVIADLCEGLDHAHSMKDPATGEGASLVHRDLSPDNVFVTTSGVTKLLDFGVAKREGLGGLTLAGELKGKIPFMAPEQLNEESVDGRTDVYAAGVVLFWLLTGRHPFDGPNQVMVMKAVLDQEPVRLCVHNPNIPPDLESVVLSCLKKNPSERMPSAAALREALCALRPFSADAVAQSVTGATELPAALRGSDVTPTVASTSTRMSSAPAPADEPSPIVTMEYFEMINPEVSPSGLGLPQPTDAGLDAGLDGGLDVDIDVEPEAGATLDFELTSPEFKRPPQRRPVHSDVAAVIVAVPLEQHAELQRLQASVTRLQAQMVDLQLVSPLLWGLEQAIVAIAALKDPSLATHVRQLQILQGVLRRLINLRPR